MNVVDSGFNFFLKRNGVVQTIKLNSFVARVAMKVTSDKCCKAPLDKKARTTSSEK